MVNLPMHRASGSVAASRWIGTLGAFTLLIPALASASTAADARQTVACCQVLELRQYSLHPGRREQFIELFDSTFADPLDAAGMTVIGQFRDLDRPDRFVWLRGFQSMAVRPVQLAAFYDSALWRSHRDAANSAIVDSDNVLMLEPTSSTWQFREPPRRPHPVGRRARAGGLVVATLYTTTTDTMRSLSAKFEKSLSGRLKAAGAQILAAYASSPQANNYPRLPIRTGEAVLVWFASFESGREYARYQTRLARDAQWQQLWPQTRALLTQEPEILRLAATARSRLRG
jgi:hypothetical protein